MEFLEFVKNFGCVAFFSIIVLYLVLSAYSFYLKLFFSNPQINVFSEIVHLSGNFTVALDSIASVLCFMCG